MNAGAEISMEDKAGNNSLMYAVSSGSFVAVQLLSKYINPEIFNHKNKEQKTVLDICKEEPIKAFLLKVGSQFNGMKRSTSTQSPNSSRNTECKESTLSKVSKNSNQLSEKSFKGEIVSPKSPNGLHRQLEPKQMQINVESFIAHKLLGKGSFGEVYLVEKKDTKVFYAMKVIDKSKMQSSL